MTDGGPVTVLEQCRVSPPTGSVPSATLPLTFLDLPYLHDPLIHHLFFYEIPNLTLVHFKHAMIPPLKHSLAVTLQHYFPLAGNLCFPRNSGQPYLRYAECDAVPLTFAEVGSNFDELTGNHAREVREFHVLTPRLPPLAFEPDGGLTAPLMAVLVSVFPRAGMCIGFAFRRVVGDGSAFTSFIRAWASVSKSGSDGALLRDCSLPFFNRSVLKDDRGLGPIYWSQIGRRKFDGSESQVKPTNNVIATFSMSQAHTQRLKQRASAHCSHVSSFTVVCAYVWSCAVKARGQCAVKEDDESDTDHFVFLADIRALLDPPVPTAYFGNCVARCFATAKTREVTGKDGFVEAARAIGEAIRGGLRREEGDVLRGAEEWVSRFEELDRGRLVGVAGSPKFAVYEMDFGWGKPKKSEVVSIDGTGSMSLNECRDPNEGLEIGLSFPKANMDAFATVFYDGLKAL